MDTKDLEIRKNRNGNAIYYKNGVIVGRRCTQCGEDKEISEFAFNNKKKGTYHPECKKCMSKRWAKNHVKEKLYNEEGLEVITRYGATTYLKNGIPVKKKCTVCGEEKEISDFYLRDKERKAYKSYCKECDKKMQIEWLKNNPNYHKEQYLNNIERHKENGKRYRENNPKCSQRWKEKNPERRKENDKRYRENNREKIRESYKKCYYKNKENNIIKITDILKQTNPILGKLNIKPYGSIYKVTHKNGHCYIGQTTVPLKERYGGNIIQGWIKERKRRNNQKFIEELNESELMIEIIDCGICKYHLDKLEAYYINKFNSWENGYNNNAGYYNTNDGIEEFIQILEENNLEFIDNKIIKKRLHE